MTEIEKPANNRNVIGWAILSLPIILILLLYIIPLLFGLGYSLTDSSIVQRNPNFVSFKNYTELFTNPDYLSALYNTFLSPHLFMRIILIVILPFSLAFLLVEMRSGARITLLALLCPLVCFSGAAVTAIFYLQYFKRGGLAVSLISASPGAWESFHTGVPLNFLGSVHNILLANGLAYALPLGTALFLAVMRGTVAVTLEQKQAYCEFWSRSSRVLSGFAIGIMGFSLAGQEGVFAFSNLDFKYESLISYSVKESLGMSSMSWGAAAIQILILILLALGTVFILLLEGGKRRVSIRFLPRPRESLFVGSAWNKTRKALLVISLAAVLLLAFLILTVFILPWLGGITRAASIDKVYGPDSFVLERLPDVLPDFFSTLVQSFGLAALTAVLSLALTAVSGFALGYLNPRGGKVLYFVLGSLIFINPAVFFIPFYLGIKELGLLDSTMGMVVPCLLPPWGVLLFTWFFQGLRDEKDALQAQGLTLKQGAFTKRLAGLFVRFSLPVLSVYLLCSLNNLLQTLTLIPGEKNLLLILIRMGPMVFRHYQYQPVCLNDPDLAGNAAINYSAVLFTPLQYLLPLALLVVSAIIVFPRLALVIRRKEEDDPALDPDVIAKLKGE